MPAVIFNLALIWLAILLLGTILLVIRARSTMVRLLAADVLTLILVAVLVLFAHREGSAYYLDAALILALLSFIGVVAAGRYYRSGRPF
jgi:multicomponent Na+:H+ antiporter subunit F